MLGRCHSMQTMTPPLLMLLGIGWTYGFESYGVSDGAPDPLGPLRRHSLRHPHRTDTTGLCNKSENEGW